MEEGGLVFLQTDLGLYQSSVPTLQVLGESPLHMKNLEAMVSDQAGGKGRGPGAESPRAPS